MRIVVLDDERCHRHRRAQLRGDGQVSGATLDGRLGHGRIGRARGARRAGFFDTARRRRRDGVKHP